MKSPYYFHILGVFVVTSYIICCVQGIVSNGGSEQATQTSNVLVKQKRGLTILPSPGNPQNIIVKRTDETLNLTCLIEYEDENDANRSASIEHNSDQFYRLSWYLPFSPQNSKQRINFIDERNSLTITISNLKESDSGPYQCDATSFGDINSKKDMQAASLPSKSVKVTVKPKKNSCGENFFACSTGECIQKRFLCDGRLDCKEGTDESPQKCGAFNPCDGKLRCEDGRCISRQWCCERSVDSNCSRVSHSCCKQLLPIQYSLDVSQYPQSQQFSDMGFLQTTIYTVIGCAMAFMFIITIMVIAICRVHLKRTNLPRYPQWNQGPQSQRQDSWGNLFLHSAGGASSGLLVTYNINNGVQFVGRPVNPPPYSEVVRPPPREGPPPEYREREESSSSSSSPSMDSSSGNHTQSSPPYSAAAQLSSSLASQQLRRTVYTLEDDPEISNLEPLLSETNNNGDSNGNNTSDVHVEPNRNLIHSNNTSSYNNIRADSPGTERERETLFLNDCQI